jgi:hypothetical protein
MIAPGLALSKKIGTAKQKKVTGDTDVEDSDASERKNDKGKKRSKEEGNGKAERDAKWTLEFALDLSAGLDDRFADLNNLKENAEHTEKAASIPISAKVYKC